MERKKEEKWDSAAPEKWEKIEEKYPVSPNPLNLRGDSSPAKLSWEAHPREFSVNLFLAINSSLTDHFLATHAINRQLTENNRKLTDNSQKLTEISLVTRCA